MEKIDTWAKNIVLIEMWFVHDTSLYYGDNLVETFGMIGEAEIVTSSNRRFVAVIDSEGPYVHFFGHEDEKPEYLTTMRSHGRPIVRFDSDGYLWFNSCLRPGEICVYDAPLLGEECCHLGMGKAHPNCPAGVGIS